MLSSPQFGTVVVTSGRGYGVLALVGVLYLGIVILNYVAVFKIITKAGYSGLWILLPATPLIASVIATIILASEANSPFATNAVAFRFTTIVGWTIVVGISLFANWVFFLVFAFSNWPVLRNVQRRSAFTSSQEMIRNTGAPTTAFTPAPAPRRVPTPTSPNAGRVYCASCGALAFPGTAFCGNCGRPVSMDAARTTAAMQVPAAPSSGRIPPDNLTTPAAAHTAADAKPNAKSEIPIQPPSPHDATPRAIPTLPTPAKQLAHSSPAVAPERGAAGDVSATSCHVCGQHESPSSAFCGNCGTPLARP